MIRQHIVQNPCPGKEGMWVSKDTHMRFANDLEIRRKVISAMLKWHRYLNFVAESHGDRTAFRE